MKKLLVKHFSVIHFNLFRKMTFILSFLCPHHVHIDKLHQLKIDKLHQNDSGTKSH